MLGFVLGITAVDPIRYGLPFERFVNPDKETLADFDIEFCDQRRDEVANYIQSKYGVDRVAQISSDDARPLPSRLVICDRPLSELVPLYSNPESGFPAAKINLSQITSAGLVQFNVINQKALTINQRTVEEARRSGVAIDLDQIPLDDSEAYRLLSKGETSTVAVHDDERYKATLLAVQPDCFEDLCAVIALSQSRLQNFIPQYVEHKRHPDLVRYFHPALESITADTHGLILYQEQLMHIVHKIAGFSFAQGDLFRRALKKSNREAIAVHKIRFINGAKSFGLSSAESTGLFEHLVFSCQWIFNKSHAVAFAMIDYQTAWLQANYNYGDAEK